MSFFPVLLEEVFKSFSNKSSVYQYNTGTNLNVYDLYKLLGRRLVTTALHILDHQTIVVYTNNSKTIEVAEIIDGDNSCRFVHLFLQINYCSCEYFKERVLIRQHNCTDQYTCQHILAVRLAIALHHKCLQYKEVPSDYLDLIIKSFTYTCSET